MPHGMCFLWNARLLALHVISDAAIALAYFSIPLILVFFIRKRGDLPFPAVFAMFGLFIVACGTNHLFDIWTIWHPTYWLSGILKAVTAIASLATAILLARIIPQALSIKSRADLYGQLAASVEQNRVTTASLLEQNRLMAMAKKMAHVGHWRIDLVSNGVFWSEEIHHIYGVPATYTPLRESAFAPYHADDRDRVNAIVESALAQGNPFTYESRIVRPDGTTRYVVASGQSEHAADGSVVAVFGVIQDVTETREAERERQRLLKRVTLATQAGRVGIWELDVRTDEIIGDSNFFELYGLPASTEPQAFDLWKRTLHPEDEERIATAIEVALHDNQPYDTEYRVIWPSGETHHIRAIGIVLRDAAGQPVQMLGTNWDNTEVRQLADQVKQEKLQLNKAIEKWTAAKQAADEAIRAAEEATQAKSEFLARMSHEIRTPMNGIIGFAILMLDSDLNFEQRRQMTYLHDAGSSLLVIINDILDFSKLEAGKLEIEQVALEPRAIVDGAVAIIRSEALAKGVALDLIVADDVPQWVVGSPTRLRQILLNLLTNALKFTHRGQIAVTASCDASAEDRLRFEIKDTGIGIAVEQQHRLFQYFSQIDASHQYGGTGLGLAISQRLVDAMHGTIGVTSAPGAGSTFWFTARLAATEPVPSTDALNVVTAIRRRILVVDDNAVNQIVVQAMLKKDGHEVVLVSDGAQAVRAVEVGDFDLVLMDMQMPVMNGEEATRAIRRLGESVRDIPIVALTANAMNEDIRRCRDAGMNHHLAKPVDRELLRHALVVWAGHHAPI